MAEQNCGYLFDSTVSQFKHSNAFFKEESIHS